MNGAKLRDRARSLKTPLAAAAIAVTLISLAVEMTVSEYRRDRNNEEVRLRQEASAEAQILDNYFARARSVTKLLARNPAYRDFYEIPGSRLQKIDQQGPAVQETNGALAYLERLFPTSIGEACFIDVSGSENARVVKRQIVPKDGLSTEEADTPFFAPTFALAPGQVYQARPYISPDTHEWVVANSTRIPLPRGAGAAIVHFEVTVESFRRQAAKVSGVSQIAVVDIHSGRTIIDSAHPQPPGEESRLGPEDNERFAAVTGWGDSDLQELDGHLAARATLSPTLLNANDWAVVAISSTPTRTWLNSLGFAQLGVIGGAALLLAFALLSFRSSHRVLRGAAETDPLTGLGNRRKLTRDLGVALDTATRERPVLLALFDLDGFKDYNDSFGHPAGDALLVRLAHALKTSLVGIGEAYRMGGDEFCALVTDAHQRELIERASEALTERGEGFSVTASRGWVDLPTETSDPSEALRLADQRMYASKASGRASAGRQTTDVLVRVLAESHPEIGDYLSEVAALSDLVGQELGLNESERSSVVQAASLLDIGKVAIPGSVLSKPGPLDEDESRFVRQHTLIGERILAVAPALIRASKLVRWSHERMDGEGYPDGIPGERIPIGSQIVAVCDAYNAMTSERPYVEPVRSEDALTELRRCAGTQFDARVVEAFAVALRKRQSEKTESADGGAIQPLAASS